MRVRQVIVILGVLLGASIGVTAETVQRPNILWITAEDISPDLGCYGDSWAHTPNLDKLASQGVVYQQAFSIAGVCAPSRSSLITGMYPTTISTHHMRCKAVPPAEVKCFTEYLRAAGYYCTNRAKTDYNFDAPLTAWDECGTDAHYRNRAEGQPFFAVFNLTITHESKIRQEDKWYERAVAKVDPKHLHKHDEAKVPPYYPDTAVTRQDWARYYDLISAMDLQVRDLLNELESAGLADNTIVFFYGDHGRGLPRAKRWLYDSGMRVPLIVRWPETLKQGSVCEDLVSFVDFGPTVLSLAGVEVPKHMQGKPFLGEQKAAKREYVYAARDRMDETYDIIRAVRDKQYKYIRNFKPGRPYAQYIDYMELMPTMREMRKMNKAGTLVGPQKLFFLPEKPVEELYDVTKDPHEINNLAAKPEHEAVLKRMRTELEDWMKRTKDLGLIEEDVLNERMRPGGEWATTADPIVMMVDNRYVVIRSETEGASIAYVIDQAQPLQWKLYSKPIYLPEDATLRAKACRLGYKDSAVVAAAMSFKDWAP